MMEVTKGALFGMAGDTQRPPGEGLKSQKDYAEARGWSEQHVNQLVRNGRIVLVNGQIDPRQADQALGQTKDPTRAAVFLTDGNQALGSEGQGTDGEVARVHGSFVRARTVGEHYRALRERLHMSRRLEISFQDGRSRMNTSRLQG
jgi:hypothetical protein